MKLKNAGIKSKKELATRMANGEVFYHDDVKVFFDESKLHPFRVCGVKTERISDAMGLVWDHFAEFKIEYKWEDELKNGPVLCWVSDGNPDDRDKVALIVSEFEIISEYRYKCKEYSWIYATPVEPSECLNLED